MSWVLVAAILLLTLNISMTSQRMLKKGGKGKTLHEKFYSQKNKNGYAWPHAENINYI